MKTKKELLEILERAEELNYYYRVDDAYLLLSEHFEELNEESFHNFIWSDSLNEMVMGLSNMSDVFFTLKDIEDIEADVFYMDGYGSVSNIRYADIDCLIDDLRDYIEREYDDED